MHIPRKRFGQNLLQDRYIIDQIIQAFSPQFTDSVIEIGPGLGALSIPLLKKLAKLTVIEIDRDLIEDLAKMSTPEHQLQIVVNDALAIDYATFGDNLRIIGNLPYNISTPLILRLLHYTPNVQDMYFMLQKEVVERIAAQPGIKAYGRLSVMVQYYCEVEHLFNVPAEAFFPQPKVESAILSIRPYREIPYPAVHFQDLERLVALAFSMRRKTLANNLKKVMSAQELTELNIDPQMRPEQITIEQYAQIAKFVAN
jgi:16S rRNA (adenine1518-N6/adenine1519-N6)-dimethyltransferase